MAKNRPELDKDTMYSMIMPSSYAPQKVDTEVADMDQQTTEPPQMRLPTPAPLFLPGGVQFSEKEPTVLVNAMERLVLEKLDAAFSKFNCCKCDRCQKDVAALALNKLPPKYIVADSAESIEHATLPMSTEVTSAIVKAILAVRAHPRH